jgi:hypothetical protein
MNAAGQLDEWFDSLVWWVPAFPTSLFVTPLLETAKWFAPNRMPIACNTAE